MHLSPVLCATCHGETHTQWQKAAASVTVAIPYLMEIISSTFPQLEVVTSTIGYVGPYPGSISITRPAPPG